MIIRYIEPKDVNDLYLLAQKAGFGLTFDQLLSNDDK